MNPETSLDAAEAELLALLRGEDAPEFSLSLECRNGRWVVRCVTPGTEQSAIEGTSDTFAEAWFNQHPLWARGLPGGPGQVPI